MTDPLYSRLATEVRDRVQADTVVILVIGRHGSITVGHAGPQGDALSNAVLEAGVTITSRKEEHP